MYLSMLLGLCSAGAAVRNIEHLLHLFSDPVKGDGCWLGHDKGISSRLIWFWWLDIGGLQLGLFSCWVDCCLRIGLQASRPIAGLAWLMEYGCWCREFVLERKVD